MEDCLFMNSFTALEMIKNGWPVLSVLVIMSILSITVIVERIIAFRRAKTNNSAFAARILEIVEKQGAGSALELCGRSSRPIAMVICDVLSRADAGREAMERAAQHALQAQINELEMYVPILGTVASTAPFVGLFGTVIGIIRAFQDIASKSGGGPEVVFRRHRRGADHHGCRSVRRNTGNDGVQLFRASRPESDAGH